jgi:uncharacterized membrane protein
LRDAVGQEMVTVFVPSSPTAFSGYVLVVPRESIIELPMSVEEAMRLLISGGVIAPAARDPQLSGKETSAVMSGSEEGSSEESGPPAEGSKDRAVRAAG